MLIGLLEIAGAFNYTKTITGFLNIVSLITCDLVLVFKRVSILGPVVDLSKYSAWQLRSNASRVMAYTRLKIGWKP